MDPDLAGTVLLASARHGERAFFERLHQEAHKETNENFQAQLLNAMGSFRDPAIAKAALPLVLSGEFDTRQAMNIPFGISSTPQTRDLAYDFVKQNWDALIAKLPIDTVGFFPFVAADYCDEQHRADAEGFFKDRVTKIVGGPRNLAQALESIRLCEANKASSEPSVVEFLKNY